MLDEPHTYTPPRARALADLPCDQLHARASHLARRWAIALVLGRPLQSIGEVPLEEIAREAPSLCAQVIRALQSDVELERLTGRGAASAREGSAPARRLVTIAGARDAATLVEAVEALRGVLWEALSEQLSGSSARLLGDVSDRLAYVCSTVLVAALDAAGGLETAVSLEDGVLAGSSPRAVAPAAHSARRAVIVDERLSATADAAVPARARAPSGQAPAPIRSAPASSDIEIRDERGEQGPAAWIGSIGAQLERFQHDGQPFAVLLVELVDLERLSQEQSPAELSRLARDLEQAVATELRAGPGSLTRERPGRCWVLVPGLDRAGAGVLAERLARAVASVELYAGPRLELALGTAACPEDGREAATLAAHADVGLYAARAAIRASSGQRTSPAD